MATFGINNKVLLFLVLAVVVQSQIQGPGNRGGRRGPPQGQQGQNGRQGPPPPPPSPPTQNNGQNVIQNTQTTTTETSPNLVVNTPIVQNQPVNVPTLTRQTTTAPPTQATPTQSNTFSTPIITTNFNTPTVTFQTDTSSGVSGSSTSSVQQNMSVNPNSRFDSSGFVIISAERMHQLLEKIDKLMFTSMDGDLSARKHIRGAFHDCTQGCDGKIDLSKTDNRGLDGFVKKMDQIYFNPDDSIFRRTLSKPDFWVLCSRRALGWAIKKGAEATGTGTFPVLNVPVYNYGRPHDNSPSNYDNLDGPFPSVLKTWPQIRADFISGMKNRLNEADLVALQGTHYLGATVKNNTGFGGSWGGRSDRNVLTHELYSHMTGFGEGRNFKQIQTMSKDHEDGGNIQIKYSSAPPPKLNNPQWTVEGDSTTGEILLNSDMNMYHVLEADSAGHVNKKWCSQQNNNTLYDCSQADSSFMPLRNTSTQVYKYAKDQKSFYIDLIQSFFKMTSVPSERDSGQYFYFTPEWMCVGNTAVCAGDIFFQNCHGLPQINCLV